MSERNINSGISKIDLEIILEANRKAIEIENEVAEQNEEVINILSEIKKNSEENAKTLEEIKKNSEEHSKDLFRMQVLFITGLLSLVIQIIQIFLKK